MFGPDYHSLIALTPEGQWGRYLRENGNWQLVESTTRRTERRMVSQTSLMLRAVEGFTLDMGYDITLTTQPFEEVAEDPNCHGAEHSSVLLCREAPQEERNTCWALLNLGDGGYVFSERVHQSKVVDLIRNTAESLASVPGAVMSITHVRPHWSLDDVTWEPSPMALPGTVPHRRRAA